MATKSREARRASVRLDDPYNAWLAGIARNYGVTTDSAAMRLLIYREARSLQLPGTETPAPPPEPRPGPKGGRRKTRQR